jgi:hypothetical protein
VRGSHHSRCRAGRGGAAWIGDIVVAFRRVVGVVTDVIPAIVLTTAAAQRPVMIPTGEESARSVCVAACARAERGARTSAKMNKMCGCFARSAMARDTRHTAATASVTIEGPRGRALISIYYLCSRGHLLLWSAPPIRDLRTPLNRSIYVQFYF